MNHCDCFGQIFVFIAKIYRRRVTFSNSDACNLDLQPNKGAFCLAKMFGSTSLNANGAHRYTTNFRKKLDNLWRYMYSTLSSPSAWNGHYPLSFTKFPFRWPAYQGYENISRVSLSRAPRFFFAPYKFFTCLPRRLPFR